MQKRLLILAPHTDDGEFGCGASIAKLIEEGWEAHYVAFSGSQESLPEGLPPDTLVKEVAAATKIVGVPKENLTVLDFRVRRFSERRQDILEVMVRLQDELDPDIVFLPSRADTHQDHQTISAEGFRAFKKTTMLGYELPWNNLSFTTNTFVLLEKEHVMRKISAIEQYKSQADRSYATAEFVRNLAEIRGTQIGAKYAEAFEAIRWIM